MLILLNHKSLLGGTVLELCVISCKYDCVIRYTYGQKSSLTGTDARLYIVKHMSQVWYTSTVMFLKEKATATGKIKQEVSLRTLLACWCHQSVSSQAFHLHGECNQSMSFIAM